MAGEDSEDDFLFLEEEDVSEVQPKFTEGDSDFPENVNSDGKEQNPNENLTPFDDDLASLSLGIQSASWDLTGMDCPDCAMKATKALQRLDSVNSCTVSATQGSVSVNIDLEQGNLAQLNSVLSSLGHAPEVGWMELSGVKASRLGERLSMDPRSLQKMLKNQPGLLDVDLSSDDRVLVQAPTDSSVEMIQARDDALRNLTGKNIELRIAEQAKLRPDQIGLLGGFIAIPLMVIVMIAEVFSAPQIAIAAVGIPAVLIGGWRMFAEAIASLRNRQLGFQVLTSLAVVGAVWLGAWGEALLVVVLVAIASHMEGKALVKARDAMQGGLDRLPRTARLVEEDKLDFQSKLVDIPISIGSPHSISTPMVVGNLMGSEDCKEAREVPLAALKIGDRLEVRSGEIVPVDGKVIDGVGSIDKAPLTGESLAVRVDIGDEVEAGLVLKRGPIVVEAMAVGDDTRLSGLIDKVHSFRDVPPRFQSTIELFTVVWIPLVLIGAPLAWFLSGDATSWKVMLLLWVVACPCALLLAAPLPHAAALANASHQGMIARGGDVLDRAARINLALLDKTGTLTSGKPTMSELVIAKGRKRDTVIKLAAGIEASSNHPYATVIRNLCNEEGLKPSSVRSLNDGKAGVSGNIDGKAVMFGRPDWINEEGVKLPPELEEALVEVNLAGHGCSVLVLGGEAIALFSFIHDDIRTGAEQLVGEMYKMGVNVEVLSGDNAAAVSAFGPRIGVPAAACRGDMTPEDKTKWVEGRARTHVVLMAGDGFNDATAMAKADIGAAVGSGEQVNLDAADILIPGDDPRMISRFIALSRKTKNVVRQNILLSVVITAILVWSVIQGINDKLWIGVIVHEASAVLVILNGARIAGDDGILKLLKGVIVDLWTDFKEAWLVVSPKLKKSKLMSRA